MKYLLVSAICLLLAAGVVLDVAGPKEKGGRISLTDAASVNISDARFEKWRVDEPRVLNYIPDAEMREWYYNHGNPDENGQRDPEGDCVQCSLGMAGVRNNDIKLATLCWKTDFGPAIRGASGPDRVAAYCRERGIRVYNITGRSVEDMRPWMEFAADSGRGAAIAFGRNHFQYLMGRDKATGHWFVCDNNSPWRVDEYTDRQFWALHKACCYWVVIPDGPAPPAPINNVIPARKASWSFWQFLEYLV